MSIIKLIREHEIEPYLDLLAEVEHIHLDRNNRNHEQWLRRRIQSHFQRGALFYGYHENEQCDAFGIVAVLHEEAPIGIPALGARAEVLDIGVSKEHRRKGIGGILLQHVEKVVKSRGAYCLLMLTYAEDFDVIAFYGKNGFVPVATIPDVFGPGAEGNTILRKILR
ncbi:GNAT family N-acetyltransferase [Paenibacillus sp. FSL K6-2859]|jgi:GNAT superfamily N-acetyltransferase|uniref:GNAT family N-acetyltransferase n=1 Tax=Paenibacillus sp. FSL K6-2859 TaxID=2921482 RepID=UPI0030FAD854